MYYKFSIHNAFYLHAKVTDRRLFLLTYYSELLIMVSIIIYYLFLVFILILFYTYFYCTIEGANGHTFHYNYIQYYCMWQIKLNWIKTKL